MKSALKIALLVVLSIFLHYPLFAQMTNEDSINQNLTDSGYTVTDIQKSKVPGLNHYTVNATKNGEKYKFKIFDSNYFLSDENGKLIRKLDFGRSKSNPPKKAMREFERHPGRKRLEIEKKKTEDFEKGDALSIAVRSDNFLASVQPSIKLGAQSAKSGVNAVLDVCGPMNFGSIKNIGRQMNSVAEVLNHTEIRKISEKTQEYEKPDAESATAKILERPGPKGNNTVAESQSKLESSVNSQEMYNHSMRMLSGVLYSKTLSGMTPDQMIAYGSMERLANSLLRQGKSKDEISSMLARQMKVLFKGNIALSGTDPDAKWTMHSNGKMTVYSLTGNRDQVLNYAAQALTFRNDPIYQAKREAWVDSTRELDTLKNRVTFEGDNKRIIELEKKVEDLSREINTRQSELLS